MSTDRATLDDGGSPHAPPHPPIRSYVLRQARMSPAQRRALDVLAPRWCLPYAPRPVDARRIFGREAPLVLEIGSGMGETTAAIAAAHPAVDFIAVEVHAPGVGSLLQKIDAAQLSNLRIIQHDAVEVLTAMIAPASLGAVHVYFPDPWPKKRHHKRRLLKPALVHELALRLVPGGYLHAATDWAEYAAAILDACRHEPLLANTADGFAPVPAWRPQTKFERRGRALGHDVFDILFTRRATP
ncbi:MAG: tRNA (guanosine(46)-N7)-methyltransferase TrmB [Proteobacteria bacterium]|nr:tRNA (guanosine(46)-N7)-methyltransferase TrmB [Pseudomonadota bacterium]